MLSKVRRSSRSNGRAVGRPTSRLVRGAGPGATLGEDSLILGFSPRAACASHEPPWSSGGGGGLASRRPRPTRALEKTDESNGGVDLAALDAVARQARVGVMGVVPRIAPGEQRQRGKGVLRSRVRNGRRPTM